MTTSQLSGEPTRRSVCERRNAREVDCRSVSLLSFASPPQATVGNLVGRGSYWLIELQKDDLAERYRSRVTSVLNFWNKRSSKHEIPMRFVLRGTELLWSTKHETSTWIFVRGIGNLL